MCRGVRCVPGLCHEPCQGVPGAGSWGFPGAPEPCSGLWCVSWGQHPRHVPYGINVHRPCCGARLCPWHDTGAHVFPGQTPKRWRGQGQGEKKKRSQLFTYPGKVCTSPDQHHRESPALELCIQVTASPALCAFLPRAACPARLIWKYQK